MSIGGVNNITFKYNPPIKKAFLKGLMPDVKNGIYGLPIDNDTVSFEHLTPASQGGGLELENSALAHKVANNKRGVDPIDWWLTKPMIIRYLKQFVNVKNKFIDGMQYIKAICGRFKIDIKEVLK